MSRETARWLYTEGSGGAAGAIEYEDGCLFVHNDSSPARGNNSSWDLVRRHRFLHLDKECDPNTPITELPSQKAMIEFAEGLPEIRSMRAKAEFQDLGPLPEPANTDWLGTPTASPFRVIPAGEFAGGEYVEPDWQVFEFVPRTGTGLDTGKSRSWKTFKTLYTAACIHLGRPCYGLPTKKGCSVIVVAEGIFGYPKRMRALARHWDIPVSELPAIIPAAPNLFQPREVDELIKQLKVFERERNRKITYVVMDHKWRCSVGANEDSASDNAVVFGSADRVSREVGCFVTLIAHVGNKDTGRARGSSSQFAAVDVEILHERTGNDIGTSTVSKCKDAEDGKVFRVRMVPVELGMSKTGEPFGSLVVEHVPGIIRQSVQRPAGKNQLAAYEAVQSGVTSFYDAISDALKRRGVKVADMDKEQRRRMKDAFLELRDKKLITLDVEANTCGVAADGDF